jgi:hypothetical protein
MWRSNIVRRTSNYNRLPNVVPISFAEAQVS